MQFARPDKLSLLIWCQRCVFPPLPLLSLRIKSVFRTQCIRPNYRRELNTTLRAAGFLYSAVTRKFSQSPKSVEHYYTAYLAIIVVYRVNNNLWYTICVMYSDALTVVVFIMIYFSRFLTGDHKIRRLFLNCITSNIFFNYSKLQYDYYLWLTHTRMSCMMHKNDNICYSLSIMLTLI